MITLLLVVALVSSCGFHVRGPGNMPPEMQRTFIAADDHHSLFYQKLRSELNAAGLEVLDSPVGASAVFTILTDFTDQRVLSVSARNVPTEYEVYYTVSYSLEIGEATLLQPRTQTQVRDYTWDPTMVLGKEQEQQQLREAIVADILRVIMIQLGAL